jgi:arginine transport system substrate-binding protein
MLFLFLLPLSYGQTLVIGTTSQNPPFSLIADKGHLYGFDLDIMENICQRIQATCKFVPFVLTDLYTQLKAGKIDLAIAAIIITDYRQKDFLLSLPYLMSNGQFMTLQQSNIKSPQDIMNKTVGVRRGTPFKGLALKIYKNNINILDFPDMPSLLDALTNKKVDVILTNAAAANYWFANTSNTYKLIGTELPTGEGYGILANKNQTELIKQINQALLDMEADGTYLKIYTRYFSKD